MKLKSKLKTVASMCAVLASLSGFAGGDAGNGGGSYVCLNPQGEVTRASLEDFVEGRIVHKFDLAFTPSGKLAVVNTLEEFDPVLSAHVFMSWDRIEKNFNESITPIKLQRASTSNSVIEGLYDCAPKEESVFMTVARYETFGLLINKTIYEKLDAQGKFGLLVHEIIFEATRAVYKDSDSERARLIVAGLFSTNQEKLQRAFPTTPAEILAMGKEYADQRYIYAPLEETTIDSEILKKLGLEDGEKMTLSCSLSMVGLNENYSLIVRNKGGKFKTRTKGGFSSYFGQCGKKNSTMKWASEGVLQCSGYTPSGSIYHTCRVRK